MNFQKTKDELIDWLHQVDNPSTLQSIEAIRKQEKKPKKRVFGSGKHLIVEVAEDFKETPDIFKDYLL